MSFFPRLRPDDPPSPPELPPPTTSALASDPHCLYARVDRAAKKKRRAGGGGGSTSESTGSTPCSPTSPGTSSRLPLSPTRSLIHKFNTLGAGAGGVRNSPTSLRRGVATSSQPQPEPLYATIGSRNRSQNASRFASRGADQDQ